MILYLGVGDAKPHYNNRPYKTLFEIRRWKNIVVPQIKLLKIILLSNSPTKVICFKFDSGINNLNMKGKKESLGEGANTVHIYTCYGKKQVNHGPPCPKRASPLVIIAQLS